MADSHAQAAVKVVNSHGLHLRPADMFVRTAVRFQAKIRVSYEKQTVDGKSIVDMLMLAARQGANLEIVAEGDDAPAAVAALVELVASGFGEYEANDK